jgi:hypothetical protein
LIRHRKYEPPSAEELKRAPDGYTANWFTNSL